jgi:hypothetical protein
MRRYEFVLAMAGLAMAGVLAPALSHSQVHQANGVATARASSTDAAEARIDDPSSRDPASQTTPERRSLMGMVMGALIESAEQQSARQRASRQAATAASTATAQTPAQDRAALPEAPMVTESSDNAARERIAVESVESEP